MKNIVLLFSLISYLGFSQHTISGTFSPVEEYTYAFLYKAEPDGAVYIDKGKLDDNGNFSIALDSTYPTGIYKIVYAIPPEENNFDFIYNGKENIIFNFSLEKGLEFTESQENKLWTSYTKSIEMVNLTISNFYQKESADEKAYIDIFKTLKDTQNAYEESTNGLLVSEFIKANRSYIPEGLEDISTYSSNLKNYYLKHIDFSSPLLQSSDFLLDRIMGYVFGIAPNADNTTYKLLVDELAEAIGDNLSIKTSLLSLVWQRFVTIKNEELGLYMIDTHLLELAKNANDQLLVESLSSFKSSALGVKAADFSLTTTVNGEKVTSTLHELKDSEQYLLVFWSSTCGHCLEELPQFMAFMKDKPNTKIIAFALEDDPTNWQKEIINFPDFTHVIGLQKWDNPMANAYNVKATPSYFILDKNKIIVGKPEQLEDLKMMLK
ncbi:TlpA disulfide reductase family protein [Ichthyenterobacterium sp. W332]|uniref:TlpA disulfide reductase family protein n=1 Tax=Microcosmobacter mediterraneus TaxID=3075607 RepID=A0ABU2YIY9_9FLAO|nr:TlpA disulfide reductase family protein [Ichthyenterobacterium sp. W332]MDT0558141.1 TlpA disulfide reductase family protein [Ichthyenterobacterium sp. W332]